LALRKRPALSCGALGWRDAAAARLEAGLAGGEEELLLSEEFLLRHARVLFAGRLRLGLPDLESVRMEPRQTSAAMISLKDRVEASCESVRRAHLLVLLVLVEHALALVNVSLETEALERADNVLGRYCLLGRRLARLVGLRRDQVNELWVGRRLSGAVVCERAERLTEEAVMRA
jgi:hypothetical protein